MRARIAGLSGSSPCAFQKLIARGARDGSQGQIVLNPRWFLLRQRIAEGLSNCTMVGSEGKAGDGIPTDPVVSWAAGLDLA